MGKIGIQCIFPPILRVQMAFYAIFQFFYVSFRQQARNLVKMKKNIFCRSISAGRYIFSNFREDAGFPELASDSTIGEPSTDSRKSESNKRFLTDSVIIILFIFSTFITYYFTFGQEPPASITALPFSGAEAPL